MLRPHFLQKIQEAFKIHPVVAILGPRQCGKTTLARQYLDSLPIPLSRTHSFDLENFNDLGRLENPYLTLASLDGLIMIDEIQKRPDLFPTLRVLVDDPHKSFRFLVLGSASYTLIQQSSETLAGRIQYLELTPFSFLETGVLETLWVRGGFPKSFLAENESQSHIWRNSYIQTFLEQDIPMLGVKMPPLALYRFWMMLAHYHGNICNYSELAKALQLSHKTTRHYADLLTGTFMVRQLQPWYENISKRQVKSHKIYIRDSGIYHALLNLTNSDSVRLSPKLGASWEGFALEEVIRMHQARPEECFFWATQGHAELDLLILKGLKKYAFEFKYTDYPKMTPSMHIALQDLKLDALTVIYPGEVSFPLSTKIEAMTLQDYAAHFKTLPCQ